VWEKFIKSIPAFYAHFGGAGDACMLLSTFYDDSPEQIIISFANSKKMMKSFFEPFEKLRKVYLLSCPVYADIHQILRFELFISGKCNGMGTTPLYSYMLEWHQNINVFEKYRVKSNPDWVRNFTGTKIQDIQVVLHPTGSAKGMVGSKRNLISKAQWNSLITFWMNQGITPIIIGTPDENADYPINNNCINKRSYSFKEQMEVISTCDLFVGADSWAKTFSALCGIPTIVFPSTKGKDLIGWKDPSDYIFLDPWKDIYVLQDNFESTFEKVRDERFKNSPLCQIVSNKNYGIVWEGAQFVNHSLALVNRELCTQAVSAGINMSLIKTEPDKFKPAKNKPYHSLLEKENISLDILLKKVTGL
jgi:hypothetical protein